MYAMRRVVYVGLRHRLPRQQHAVLTGVPWRSAARAFSAASPVEPEQPPAERAGSAEEDRLPNLACALLVGKVPALAGSQACAPGGSKAPAMGGDKAPASDSGKAPASSDSPAPSSATAPAPVGSEAPSQSGAGAPPGGSQVPAQSGSPSATQTLTETSVSAQQQPARIRDPNLWVAVGLFILGCLEFHFKVFQNWRQQKKDECEREEKAKRDKSEREEKAKRDKSEREEKAKRDKKVETNIVNSTIKSVDLPVYVDRNACMNELERYVIDREDRFSMLVQGNYMVGKSAIVSRLLEKKQGVVYVPVSDNDEKAIPLVMKVVDADNEKQLKLALVSAAARLGEKPIVVLDIPRKITKPDVMDTISLFAKNWCFELQLVKVIVVASTAAAALAFDPDGRSHSIFVAPLTKEEFDQPQVTEFIKHHGGKEGVDHKQDIYHLTGGNLGKVESLLMDVKKVGWDRAQSNRFKEQEKDIDNYLGIDKQGGFGKEKERVAAELARAVARAPFEEGASARQFSGRFSAQEFAIAVRARGTFPLYFNSAENRYYAVSPSVHQLLRQQCPEPEVQKPRGWRLF